MKTRQKAKLQTEGHGDNGQMEVDTSFSQASDAGNTATSLELTIPSDISLEGLQTLLPDLPLTNPTSETLVAIYRLALEQATILESISKERDQAKADVARIEVELDQALQDQDVEAERLRTSMEELHTEVENLRKEKIEFGMHKILKPLSFISSL